MNVPHQFIFMERPFYGPNLAVSGVIGLAPDTSLLGHLKPVCVRSRLPKLVENLIFTLPEPARRGDVEQNFFIHSTFFIMTEDILNFFIELANCSLDIQKVTTLRYDGTRTHSTYYAICPTTVVDCIDPDRSLFGRFHPDISKKEPFSEGITQYTLDPILSEEFSNSSNNTYISYPRLYQGVSTVHILDEKIPRDTQIFQPKHWPGVIIATKAFANKLESICKGGTPGCYFWALDLEDLNKSHAQYLHDFR